MTEGWTPSIYCATIIDQKVSGEWVFLQAQLVPVGQTGVTDEEFAILCQQRYPAKTLRIRPDLREHTEARHAEVLTLHQKRYTYKAIAALTGYTVSGVNTIVRERNRKELCEKGL